MNTRTLTEDCLSCAQEAVNDLENLMALIRDCARAGLKTPNDKRSYGTNTLLPVHNLASRLLKHAPSADDLEECAKRLGDRVNELAEHMDPTYRNKKEREVRRVELRVRQVGKS
jgi:hypothetical protein